MLPSIDSNKEILHRIARYLIINAGFTNNISLLHGKMGIVIFFFHYARYMQNAIYDEFAGELLDEVYEEADTDMLVGFENGLCGIAWGIEYLIQQGFVEGDPAVVLKDIDLRVMERDPKRIRDLSFDNGLAGIGYYVACHVGTLNYTALDDCYIEALSAAMLLAEFKVEDRLPASVLSFFADKTYCGEAISFPCFLFDELLVITGDSDWRFLPMGIEKGLAGLGLKLMGI